MKRFIRKYAITGILIIIILAVVAAAFLLIKSIFNNDQPQNSTSTTVKSITIAQTTSKNLNTTDARTQAPTTTTQTTTNKATSTTGKVDYSYAVSDDVAKGNLVLVNSTYHYSFPKGVERVYMNDYQNKTYSCSYSKLPINKECLPYFLDMLKTFKSLYSDKLTIVSGYRPYSSQERIFNNGVKNKGYKEALKWYALPGASEHHTGYAFDFITSYTGSGNYKWINDNCYKYGFVVRYKPEKSSITGISSEPWHFRYVGIPHAYYMTKNNLCLEEYVELLNNYPENSEHLIFTDHNSDKHEVYFVKAKSIKEVTNPEGNYTISGNNIDGFIVTITDKSA